MSEEASEHQFSRGSSLSLFSGFGGASTVSGGGSDPGVGGGFGGVVNIEELTDDQLETTVDDLKTALRILILETLMFETFYERLLAGQAQIRATPTDSAGMYSQVTRNAKSQKRVPAEAPKDCTIPNLGAHHAHGYTQLFYSSLSDERGLLPLFNTPTN